MKTKQSLRALILFLMLYPLAGSISGQHLDTIPSIVFKAKLMTMSRYGLTTEEGILATLRRQATRIICDYKGVTIVWISGSDRYWQGETISLERLDTCSFIVGYNKSNFTFYRLRGFNCIDAYDFFGQLDSADLISLLEDKLLRNEIDLLKLYNWISKKKNRRKQCQCKSCDDGINTVLQTY